MAMMQSELQRARPVGAKVPRWSAVEDEKLKGLVAELGDKNWKEVASRLEHGRSATAVEQHYNIIIGKRKRPGAKEGEGEGELSVEPLDEAGRAAKAHEVAEAAAQRQADREAKAAEKEAKAAEVAKRKAEKDAQSEAKAREKEERRRVKEEAAAIKAEKAEMPKKPRSSYLFFCEETRDALKRDNPDLIVTDLAKLQGAAWKELDDSDKQRYLDKAAADVERYKAEMETGGWEEKIKEMNRREEERCLAAGIEPPSKKHKSPGASSRSRKKVKLIEWYVPEGYALATTPPTASQLAFNNEAGDQLVGKHIMFNWEGVGWCEGVIDSRNKDASNLMDLETGDIVNFVVYYEIDDDRSSHNLELQDHGGGPAADFGNWALLELTPAAASGEEADAVEEQAAVTEDEDEGAEEETAAMQVEQTPQVAPPE